jgi:hypothetical protein
LASIRLILNRWVIIGSFLFACILVFVFGISILLLRPEAGDTEVLPPLVQKIPAGTSTPSKPQSGSEYEEQASTGLSELEQVSPSPAPGEITIGTLIKISGTGGDGLRLREEPGLGGDVRMLGEEAEVFLVDSGPQKVDGYVWWYLTGYYDETRGGWAVVDYLSIVENP